LWRKLTFQHGRLDEMLDGVEAYRKGKRADVVVYGHSRAKSATPSLATAVPAPSTAFRRWPIAAYSW
jgi:hypothetical protein